MLYHANQHLICGVDEQLEPNNCLFGIPIPLKLDKLHRIMFAMPWISYHDHADSSFVVVSGASVVCSSALLLPG
jgi:hypothetical protein